MSKNCYSCGMPLDKEFRKSEMGIFCTYCADEKGKVYPREAVQKGIADWLKSFSPPASDAEFLKRADNYMKAMPAWAK